MQAHMGSTRLPGKVMLPLAGGHPVLWHDVMRVRMAKRIEQVIVATSDLPADDVIADFCKKEGFECFRGSDEDVVSRYYECAKKYGVDTVVRVTSDCPLIDPGIIDMTVDAFAAGTYEYISTSFPGPRELTIGLDVEAFSFAALERANKETQDDFDRSHGIWEREGKFNVAPKVKVPAEFLRPYRVTLDYPEDYAVISHLYVLFYKEGEIVSATEAIRYLDTRPDVLEINAHCVQKRY